MKNNLLRGFTLSEALMALAIVGIISALTIPTVVKNYQKHAYIIGLKKVYSDLQQNLTILQTDNYRNRRLSGTIFNLGHIPYYTDEVYLHPAATIENTTGQFLKTYYKYNQDCGKNTQPCFADNYGKINGGEEKFTCSDGYSILTPSGAAICMIPIKTEEKPTSSICRPDSPSKYCKLETVKQDHVIVYVDTNGAEGPNIGGRDMFTFNIYDDFSIDVVQPEEIKNATAETSRNTLFDQNCFSSSKGIGCFGKILNDNWKMNY